MATASSVRPLPLAGIRVLDLTTFLSGPSATQLLADLGADVVKIEPAVGDSSRSIPPHFLGEDSAYYLANNRNKRSVVLDLKHPEGLDIALRLIGASDVVIENFRPGVCERLGIDKHAVTTDRPELVWASISGFGQVGPHQSRPAYDMIVQAMSGVMSLTGHPGQPAARLGVPAGDVVAGMYAVIGVLSALVSRAGTGVGRIVDVSMLDSQLSQLSYQSVYAMMSGQVPGRQGAGHDSIPTYRSFLGSDGAEFVVTANTQAMWERLCIAIEEPRLPLDPRFLDQSLRLQHKHELWRLLEKAFAEHPAAEWVSRLIEQQVPCAPIRDVAEALDDARASGRGMVIELNDGSHSFEAVATPILFEDSEIPPLRYPPRLGEQTREVLGEVLSLTPEECDRLVRSGAVFQSDTCSDPLSAQHRSVD
ncbi:CoA transferase [Rhodococcus sp. IEGM 1366]|uniref:CaiB/BaiF CoA transferase family protein n=1 Tax=Rhodococcus sp. IEGM 1366 TaxID=3082223 RepID=UPI00295452D8|nr:CoA transferase [Rhodococcus sp. IEGM 1366]MDV8070609.1 CoA transferase [Rhodococcus sp. IEGM 1366]